MDKNKVSTGKPKITGSVFSAPLGTTLPTNVTDDLDVAFVHHGYCSDDGMTNGNSPETDKIKAWGGAVVLVIQKGKEDTFKMKLIESLNVNNIKAVYGSANVSGNLEDGIAVSVNAEEAESRSWVIDVAMNGAMKRIVIPEATISEMGEIKYTDSEAVGYEITLSAVPDENGNSHYEYIKKSGMQKSTLSGLSIASISLDPVFDADVMFYEAETSDSSNTVTATAASGAVVVILVNGNSLTNGTAPTWKTGKNVIEITVTETGKSSTRYVVEVTKEA